MQEIKLKINKNGEGAFFMYQEGEQIGEMRLAVNGQVMTVYHTEIIEREEGKGLAKQLFNEMFNYVREHHLKVVAVCPYVSAQFKRHQQQYEDIWVREED